MSTARPWTTKLRLKCEFVACTSFVRIAFQNGLNLNLDLCFLWFLTSGTLEGKRTKPEYDKLLSDPMLKFSGLYQEGCSDLYVTCQVLSDGVPLALPVTTSYKAFTNRWK